MEVESERRLSKLLLSAFAIDRAKILRSDRITYLKDNGDDGYLQLLNIEHWCRNQFQVTRQVTMDKGTYKNRYDVTLLINGLPLVQIELKRQSR